jgi:SAM-dependent methyltransferase
VSVDHYARSGRRWALGATLVYAPIAAELIAMCPHRLAGRRVLDAGAGTGVASAVLSAQGAQAVATDLSRDMLAWDAAARPAAAVADIRALPFDRDSFDDGVAAFVLNHLDDPGAGLAELRRVTRPGGAVLQCAFSTASGSEVRDRIDAVAMEHGWRVPDWYVQIKSRAVPLMGSSAAAEAVLRGAGLVDVVVAERAVDVGVDEPEQLVAYRFGQAHFAGWLDGIGAERAAEVAERAAEVIRPVMRPYRPIVVFSSSRVP